MPKKKTLPIRDAVRTKARILEKATRLVAKKGFDGATTNEIIESAHINKRMLFYYFGNKKGLYRAVFIDQWGALKAEIDRAMAERLAAGEPLGVREALVAMLDILFDFMATHHDLLRLMMWEGLEGGAISRSIWKDVRGPLFEQAVFLVRQAQQDGIVDERVDPAQYIVSFLGAITFYFAYAHTMPDMIGTDPFSPKALAHRREQVLAIQEATFTKRP